MHIEWVFALGMESVDIARAAVSAPIGVAVNILRAVVAQIFAVGMVAGN